MYYPKSISSGNDINYISGGSKTANEMMLTAYRKAINEIDDYFEYARESAKDQKKVYQILGNLTDSLKTILKGTK